MKKIAKKIVVILCLILILLNGGATTVSAATYTTEEASQAVANFSISYYNSMASQVHYYVADWASSNSERAKAYLKQSNACSHGYTYGFDCVGWVSIAIHESLGIGSDTAFSYFVTPQNLACDSHYSYTAGSYDTIKNSLIPGDILICSQSAGSASNHVMVYVGNGMIVHCASGLQYQAVTESNYHSRITGYARLVDTSDITSISEEYLSATTGSSSSSTTGSGEPMSNFYFNGIPDGEYSIASTNLLSAIIDTLAQVADYIIGILTFGPRVVIVGWTALVDQLVTSFVNSLVGNGEVDESGISSVEIDSASSSDRVTIENLVYNLYAPLDINIFK